MSGTRLFRIVLFATLIATPGIAAAQGALSTLKRSPSSSQTTTYRAPSSRPTHAGELRTLTARTSRLGDTDRMVVEPWLSPSKKGHHVEIVSSPCQGYVLVEEYPMAKRSDGRDSKAYMVDLASGERSKTISSPGQIQYCEGDYFVVGSRRASPAAFHIPTKSWSVPHIDVPAGVSPSSMMWVKPLERDGEAATEFIVRAFHGESLDVYQGVWKPGEESITLGQTMPWDGVSRARYRGDLIDVIGFEFEEYTSVDMFGDGPTSTSTRTRTHLYRVDETFSTTHSLDLNQTITFLAGGYTTMGTQNEAIILLPDGGETRLDMAGCNGVGQPFITAVGPPSAPSVLYACRTNHNDSRSPDEMRYVFAYWSPDGSTSWEATLDGQLIVGNWSERDALLTDFPIQVLGVSPFAPQSTPHHLWFDTRTGTTWEGKARYSLAVWPRQMPTRLLATDQPHQATDLRRDKKINLYLVDIEQGTETLLHTYNDCPGAITSEGIVGDIAEVRCVTNDKPKIYRFVQHWSEAINLKDVTRWRAPQTQAIEHIFEDGSFVITDVKKGANIIYAMSKELWRARFD